MHGLTVVICTLWAHHAQDRTMDAIRECLPDSIATESGYMVQLNKRPLPAAGEWPDPAWVAEFVTRNSDRIECIVTRVSECQFVPLPYAWTDTELLDARKASRILGARGLDKLQRADPEGVGDILMGLAICNWAAASAQPNPRILNDWAWLTALLVEWEHVWRDRKELREAVARSAEQMVEVLPMKTTHELRAVEKAAIDALENRLDEVNEFRDRQTRIANREVEGIKERIRDICTLAILVVENGSDRGAVVSAIRNSDDKSHSFVSRFSNIMFQYDLLSSDLHILRD